MASTERHPVNTPSSSSTSCTASISSSSSFHTPLSYVGLALAAVYASQLVLAKKNNYSTVFTSAPTVIAVVRAVCGVSLAACGVWSLSGHDRLRHHSRRRCDGNEDHSVATQQQTCQENGGSADPMTTETASANIPAVDISPKAHPPPQECQCTLSPANMSSYIAQLQTITGGVPTIVSATPFGGGGGGDTAATVTQAKKARSWVRALIPTNSTLFGKEFAVADRTTGELFKGVEVANMIVSVSSAVTGSTTATTSTTVYTTPITIENEVAHVRILSCCCEGPSCPRVLRRIGVVIAHCDREGKKAVTEAAATAPPPIVGIPFAACYNRSSFIVHATPSGDKGRDLGQLLQSVRALPWRMVAGDSSGGGEEGLVSSVLAIATFLADHTTVHRFLVPGSLVTTNASLTDGKRRPRTAKEGLCLLATNFKFAVATAHQQFVTPQMMGIDSASPPPPLPLLPPVLSMVVPIPLHQIPAADKLFLPPETTLGAVAGNKSSTTIANSSITNATDAYSVGMLLLAMICGDLFDSAVPLMLAAQRKRREAEKERQRECRDEPGADYGGDTPSPSSMPLPVVSSFLMGTPLGALDGSGKHPSGGSGSTTVGPPPPFAEVSRSPRTPLIVFAGGGGSPNEIPTPPTTAVGDSKQHKERSHHDTPHTLLDPVDIAELLVWASDVRLRSGLPAGVVCPFAVPEALGVWAVLAEGNIDHGKGGKRTRAPPMPPSLAGAALAEEDGDSYDTNYSTAARPLSHCSSAVSGGAGGMFDSSGQSASYHAVHLPTERSETAELLVGGDDRHPLGDDAGVESVMAADNVSTSKGDSLTHTDEKGASSNQGPNQHHPHDVNAQMSSNLVPARLRPFVPYYEALRRLCELISSCTAEDPSARPTAHMVRDEWGAIVKLSASCH